MSLRLAILAAGAAAGALCVETPALAWTHGRHHDFYARYHHHYVRQYANGPATTGYRWGAPNYGWGTGGLIGGVVGGAETLAADVVGGAGAVAGGLLGATYPYGYSYPYTSLAVGTPYGYSYPYAYNYNCAYAYPSAVNASAYCPVYGYWGSYYPS